MAWVTTRRLFGICVRFIRVETAERQSNRSTCHLRCVVWKCGSRDLACIKSPHVSIQWYSSGLHCPRCILYAFVCFIGVLQFPPVVSVFHSLPHYFPRFSTGKVSYDWNVSSFVEHMHCWFTLGRLVGQQVGPTHILLVDIIACQQMAVNHYSFFYQHVHKICWPAQKTSADGAQEQAPRKTTTADKNLSIGFVRFVSGQISQCEQWTL